MKKLSLALILSGVIVIVGALGFVVFNLADSLRAKRAAETLLSSIADTIDEQQAPESQPHPDGDTVPEMPVLEKDGLRYIGVIDIPSLSLSLPVLAEWSYDLLKVSPCYYSGSYFTNDLVICAHNYRYHFGRLLRIAIGAEIYFTAVNGETHRYIISNRETLRPDENDRMITADGSWDLTLFTCYLGGQTRCTLRCTLADPQ